MNESTQHQENTGQTTAVDTPSAPSVAPLVNILETGDAFVLEAEMPGVNKDGLNVSVDGNILTLAGHRQVAPETNLFYRESTPADFRRTFELDPSIESAKITAKIKQGVLYVTLPKAEQVKPRRIDVN